MNNRNNYLGESQYLTEYNLISDHLPHLLLNIERTVGELCEEEIGEAAVVLGDDDHQHLAG